jgi:precorrin-2 dehydrogenase/sirohydrochlorin ferrochelatase
MKYYPLFMDLGGRECLVVGAGAVAARKARSLLDCGAVVTVVGEAPAAAFRALERRGVVLRERRFRASDVGRQALVIAATDDRSVNAAVSAAARRRGIPVNAVDDPPNCTFIVPAVVRRGDLTVAISTGGKSPAAARLVKEQIAALLGEEHAALVRLLGAHRGRMKDLVQGQGRRARAWKRMLEDGVLESLRKRDTAGAEGTVRRCIADATCGNTGQGPKTNVASAGRRGGAEGRSPAARSSERAPTEVRSVRTPKPARRR